MTERELQNKFVKWLSERKKDNEVIFEEVDTMYNMIDVIKYSRNEITGYELKLTNTKKVIEQCTQSIAYCQRLCIVMPGKQIEKILNDKEKLDQVKRYKIGLIGFVDGDFIVMRRALKHSKDKELHWGKFNIMDRIIRGFHLNGINARKSYR